jgi:tRNA A-37 threonylcarbamoyl transferase component Bud32
MNEGEKSMPKSKNFTGNVVHTSNLFHPGQTLGGRYQIISCLGRGGMGVVYHVNQVFVNKEMALKTIETRGLSDAAMRRFQQEARSAFAVQHPNIIAVNDFGVLDDQTPFLVMELISGETLAERLKRKTSLSIEEAIPIFVQICFALAHAHTIGVVHRDIKPSNIMLLDDVTPGTEGSVKIVDFGIAKFAADGEEAQSLTRTGEIFGSPLYMSPEQCAAAIVDHRSDVYSLGCVLFEVLTGTPPFIGDTALTTMIKHQTEAAPTLRQASLGKEFPEALEQIVATMLAKSPGNRYQNLGMAADDLAATMRGDAVPIRAAVSYTENSNPFAKTHTLSRSLFFGSVLITILLSATLAGFAAYNIKRTQPAEPLPPTKPARAAVVRRAEENALPLNADDLERAQIMSPSQLAEHLKDSPSDGRLSLHFKTLNTEGLRMISDTKWIRYLDLESSIFDNKDMALLERLPLLDHLYISGSNFDDSAAVELSRCKNLKKLEAGGTNLTDKGLMALTAPRKLVYLDLASTKITDEGLKSLCKLPLLSELRLRGIDNISGQGLVALQSCPLTSIDLGNTNIDDAGLKNLSTIPTLRSVKLTKTPITISGLSELCAHKNIREININRCPNITKHEIDALKAKAPWVNVSIEAERPELQTGI